MTMKTIAIMLTTPFTARNAGFWMLICGRDRTPAISANSPTIRVVIAVKFLSFNLFRILPASAGGLDSMMKPKPKIPSHKASMYLSILLANRVSLTMLMNPRTESIARIVMNAFDNWVSL